MDPDPLPAEPQPSLWQWTLGYLIVGMAWGLTTPFIRKAAVDFQPPKRPFIDAPENSWLKRKLLGAFFTVLDLLRSPQYAIPLLINLTGSVWCKRLFPPDLVDLIEDAFGSLPAGGQGRSVTAMTLFRPKRPRAETSAAELSLTVPITNSLAFLFTVLGEWWVEGKLISRGKYHRRARFGNQAYVSKTHGLA